MVFANPLLELTTVQSLQTRQFWQIFLCKIISGTAGLFAVVSFKTIGLKYNYSDEFITVAASVATAIDGMIRPFWGQGVDKLTYKYIYMIILTNQIVACATFPLVAGYAPAYFIWICFLFPCVGCHMTMLAPISLRIFGRTAGTRIFGFFALAIGTAGMLAYLLQVYVVKYIGYETFFWILSGLSGVAFISNLFFSEVIRK
jgi:MFS family permease